MTSGILGHLVLFVFLLIATDGSIHVCPNGCEFQNIQTAIDAAPASGKVVVEQGNYSLSSSLHIDKPLELVGENHPILLGDGVHDVLLVSASDVTVMGLEIRNEGTSYLKEISGIRIEDAKNCRILNNRVVSKAYSIYLANSSNCTVSNNQILGSYRSESESGNGIHSWSGRHHLIEGNTIQGHRDGIYLEFTNESILRGNDVRKNIRYGLHFMTSHKNTYEHNRFEENGAGVAVMYSRNVKMIENTFANNRGAAAYGLLLKDISASEIRANIFRDNTYAVYMEGTNRSTFRGNQFCENGYALKVLGDCDDNSFQDNDFSGNTFDLSTNSSRNPNSFERNYWSNFHGFDLDRDGFGDVPYRPVSLSSILLEHFDSTYVLVKSPLLMLFDSVEQAFPMLIPETLKDEHPRMAPLTKEVS